MKLSILATVLVAAAVTGLPAQAQSPKPPAKGEQAQPVTPSPAEFDKQLAQMRGYMQQMQAQMGQIQQTQDPQERQRLLQEHWTSMQAAMSTMRGMWGPAGAPGVGCCANGPAMGPGMMMGGPMMGWSQMHSYYSGLTPEQLRQRQYMMDQYMPMQQMMMDHMMWHQRWMTPSPAPATK